MKARIGVMSEELIRIRLLSIAAGTYKPQKNEPKVWYTSLNAVSQVLCPENIELIKMMESERPETLSELAELSGRHVSNLSKTLRTLENKGFIRLEKKGKSVKPVAIFTDFEIVTGKDLEATFRDLQAA